MEKEITTQNESEAVVEDTTNAVAVAPEVEAPAVEASRPTVTAPIYAKPWDFLGLVYSTKSLTLLNPSHDSPNSHHNTKG